MASSSSSSSSPNPTQLHLSPHATRTQKLPRTLPLRTPAAALGGAVAGEDRSAPPRPRSMSSYVESLQNGTVPDPFTFPPLLKSLSDSNALLEGETIHAHVVKMGFERDLYVRNNLIRLYAVCGDLVSAHNLFDQFPQRDVVSWTTLISGYSKMGLLERAIEVFLCMVDEGFAAADAVAIVAVLAACAKLGDLDLGRRVHRYVDSSRIKLDVFAWNALISMYAKCGDIDSAYKCFKKMPRRNVVSWNAMISGFVRAGEFERALSLFKRMQGEGIEPDDATLVGVLNSCTSLGALEMGRWVHVYVVRIGSKADGVLGNALVDMYAKCGMIDHAMQVFDEMRKRDVYAYTSMIVGLAMHGRGEKALNLFDEMLRVGISPNRVTFVGVLSACTHAGLVELGLRHFEDMSSVYNITPQLEHYGCVVDMLGRAGYLDRAREFIGAMPVEPDAFIWGSLLGACKIHGEVAMGESVMKHLLTVENEEDGSYVLLSNIYAANNRCHDSNRVRKAMRRKKVKKTPGCSSIEIDGVVHEFGVKKKMEA
ncbi:Pentatricopeptide repeat-containing protein, chloroplastic [Ananas comosus]|uniref:Pentatricopeptide repeat-containing protein, chloroplastic n=1 Tax=Ananas comosus TaxID=4615 RepID=A0A199VGJ4_ANACO|nr:Pentatricopeptide repeat-containing protein, chloroplastic [Ananas comosus]